MEPEITIKNVNINERYWEQRLVGILRKNGIETHMHYFEGDFGRHHVLRRGPMKGKLFRNDPWWGSFEWYESAGMVIRLGERKLLDSALEMVKEFSQEYSSHPVKIEVPEK